MHPIGLPVAGQQQASDNLTNCHNFEAFVYAHDVYVIQRRRVGVHDDSWHDLEALNFHEMDAATARLFVNGLNLSHPDFVHRARLVVARCVLPSSVGGSL